MIYNNTLKYLCASIERNEGTPFSYLIQIYKDMLQTIDINTPIAMLTVGQFQDLIKTAPQKQTEQITKDGKRYVYGIAGIAQIFGCSIPTANRIKARGKIDKAITQIGRKIIVDADLALELAGEKNGGRHK